MEKLAVASPNRALTKLDKLRVLVVEDEVLIAMLLEDALDELGCELVGPYQRLSDALAAANSDSFDVALVDWNLHGEQATPIARRLAELGHPFAIASGAGADVTGYGEAAHLHKPFKVEDVKSVLRLLCSQTDAQR